MTVNWTSDELVDELHKLRLANDDLRNEVDEYRMENTELRLRLAEAELKLNVITPWVPRRILNQYQEARLELDRYERAARGSQ